MSTAPVGEHVEKCFLDWCRWAVLTEGVGLLDAFVFLSGQRIGGFDVKNASFGEFASKPHDGILRLPVLDFIVGPIIAGKGFFSFVVTMPPVGDGLNQGRPLAGTGPGDGDSRLTRERLTVPFSPRGFA